MLKTIALFAFAMTTIAVSGANAGPRSGGDCDDWGCGMNGTQLTGVADFTAPDTGQAISFRGCDDWMCGSNGTKATGVVPNAQDSVTAIILPNGYTVDLR